MYIFQDPIGDGNTARVVKMPRGGDMPVSWMDPDPLLLAPTTGSVPCWILPLLKYSPLRRSQTQPHLPFLLCHDAIDGLQLP